jgi:hypothetical protein
MRALGLVRPASANSPRPSGRRGRVFAVAVAAAVLSVFGPLLGQANAEVHAHRAENGQRAHESSSPANDVVSVAPAVVEPSTGAARTTYALPDGETITDTTPPPNFDPLTASDAALQQYGFPLPPADGAGLQAWKTAMSAFRSDPAPTGALSVDLNPSAPKFSTFASNWAGFTAGQWNSQSDAFVAVQATTTVPTANGCTANGWPLGAWIGLGGTFGANDLVQQGEECGTPEIPGGGFRSFEEFADTLNPVAFCGYSSWVFGAGDVLYQQMSYQTSSNTANFYIEDENTGVAHGCAVGAPRSRGWSFDGNTADYELETPAGATVPFSTVHFGDAQLEWSSGSWVAFGTRPTTKTYDGVSLTNYCAGPSTIGSDHESFSVSYSSGECFQ